MLFHGKVFPVLATMFLMDADRSATFNSEYFFTIVAMVAYSSFNMFELNMPSQGTWCCKWFEAYFAHWSSDSMKVYLNHHMISDILIKFVEGFFRVYYNHSIFLDNI